MVTLYVSLVLRRKLIRRKIFTAIQTIKRLIFKLVQLRIFHWTMNSSKSLRAEEIRWNMILLWSKTKRRLIISKMSFLSKSTLLKLKKMLVNHNRWVWKKIKIKGFYIKTNARNTKLYWKSIVLTAIKLHAAYVRFLANIKIIMSNHLKQLKRNIIRQLKSVSN